MIKLFRLAILALLTIVLLALAVANRHGVTLHLDPLAPSTQAGTTLQPPLFFVILLSAIIGVVLGAIVTWLSQGRWRRQAKMRAAEAAKLKRSVALLEIELAEAKKARPALGAKFFGAHQGLTH
jgi:uncharacterized integral membrane protein